MLSERAQSLLKVLVERYIAEGQPVGSRALSRFSALELSPATIRNVMADLEEMGFVTSPHTSAGRVPTPKGYRLFVDTLLTVRPMEEVERQQLEEACARRPAPGGHGRFPDPFRPDAFRRHRGRPGAARCCATWVLRPLGRRVLLIIVASDGEVQNRVLVTDRSYSPSQLTGRRTINQRTPGSTSTSCARGARRDDRPEPRHHRADGSGDQTGGEALRHPARHNVVISGGRNLLGIDISGDMPRLRFCSSSLSARRSSSTSSSRRARRRREIFIGGEVAAGSARGCSIVTARGRRPVDGTVGVIGPGGLRA
jgi:heat-inducible transcriptional repressor